MSEAESQPAGPDAPRISVIVPIYDVERYLAECLESIAQQTFADLEVVMVDDGSTDGSAAIAQGFVRRDPRFRLVTQPNGGLGKARNTGADAARGEFLAFVDSDDKLALNFCELLVGALDETGSDFATGNVLRFNSSGTRQAPFLARTFTRTRLATHVTRFAALLVDRIAPNKLWRRTFWEEHGLRFPEGVVHEDVPVVVPAQFLARSVDVIAEPVYLYREREEGEDRSITQRRHEKKMLLDRLAGVESVTEFLGRHVGEDARRSYQESAVAEDLRYYLNVVDEADDEYHRIFLDRVNAYLDAAGPDVEAGLPAIDRLKYHLVRRRLLDELLEVLRFHKQELADTPPIRVGGEWYGDYPFRGDPRLGIPSSVYRLGVELRASAVLEALTWEDGVLRLDGYASITVAGAPAPGEQQVRLLAVRPGRLARVRRRVAPLRLSLVAQRRPEDPDLHGAGWVGFQARLDLRRLRRLGRWRDQTLELFVTVRNGGTVRRFSRFSVPPEHTVEAIDRHVADTVVARAARVSGGRVRVRVQRRWAQLRDHRALDGAVELRGALCLPGDGAPVLEVSRADAPPVLRVPLELATGPAPQAFTARLALAALADPALAPDGGWELWIAGRGERERVALPAGVAVGSWGAAGAGIELVRTLAGDAALVPPGLPRGRGGGHGRDSDEDPSPPDDGRPDRGSEPAYP